MNKTIPSQAVRKRESAKIQIEKRNLKLAQNPTCSMCKKTKTVSDFPESRVDYRCRQCIRECAIERYHKQRKLLDDGGLVDLKEKVNDRQNKNRLIKLKSMTKEELEEFRTVNNKKNLEKRNEVRDIVYNAYGGYKCACCGESTKAFLSLDHINNDGAKHKREAKLKTGEQMHRWIIRNNFPKMFQVLCMNCNWGKRMNNGICPHKEV